tara:strand:+ start:469 stop:576 length:108 start_codon:yes stop_codon:yes gene_type:complete
MEKIKEVISQAKHFWTEHKKISIAFAIILLIAIIV